MTKRSVLIVLAAFGLVAFLLLQQTYAPSATGNDPQSAAPSLFVTATPSPTAAPSRTPLPVDQEQGQSILRSAREAERERRLLEVAFRDASREFGVPERVLKSVSYNLSRWEHHNGESSTTGGFGLMHLPGAVPIARPPSPTPDPASSPTPLPSPTPIPPPSSKLPQIPVLLDDNRPSLSRGARLLGLNPRTVRDDPYHNIRAGAALLAEYAQTTVGDTPADEALWYGAVAKYTGSLDAAIALDFADVVYQTINDGVSRQTSEGGMVTIAAKQVTPDKSTADSLGLQNTSIPGADCPPDLPCQFVPIYYQLNDSVDFTDYGNYEKAMRPDDGMQIDYIVVHDAELPSFKTVQYFQQPWAGVSSHYSVRAYDGMITQMVANKDIAWTAGNKYMNMHSINIEHEGYAITGAAWYSEQMYRQSARLVRYLAEKYDIPLDRAHIIGHDDVPGVTPAKQSHMHWDPGPYWDWERYMELIVGAPIEAQDGPNSDHIVTIKPNFASNKPKISYCFLAGCRTLPELSTSFVHLYQGPGFDESLLDDHALASHGTDRASDWGDKAAAGQQFYRVERHGEWDAIWFGSQKAWFHNPADRPTAVHTPGTLITPKAGLTEIPIFGRPYPEAAVYPPAYLYQPPIPLQYTIPAGQHYVAKDLVKGDEYFGGFGIDWGTFIQGQEEYYVIFFNHRLAYVRASDVDVITGE